MLTLIESAKVAANQGDIHRAGIIEEFASSSAILETIGFVPIAGASYTVIREKTLPGVGFRKVNADYTESTGTFENIPEPLKICGGDLDVDTFIVAANGASTRAVQEAAQAKALSLTWTKKFIKGDAQTSNVEFDGLQARIGGSQLIEAGATSGGDALSLAKLDELIDEVDGGNALIMNKTMRRLLTAAARNTSVGGFITHTTDSFGRQITKYNDYPILIVDKDETDTSIMGFTEAGGGGGTTSTSIYCASFSQDGLIGIENGGLRVKDLGELDTSPVYRTRVEWFAGIAQQKSKSVARLRGISNAAVVV